MNKKIVVLYKKTNTAPVIKIVANMLEIKKMIIQGDLDMVRYENCIIVCNAQNRIKNAIPNIVLDFKHIAGDFFLIGYNPKIKDFRSLSKDEVLFYKKALDRKSFQHDTYKKWIEKCKLTISPSPQNHYIKQQSLNQQLNNDLEKCEESQNTEKALDMILNIQAVILQYIKKMNGEQ